MGLATFRVVGVVHIQVIRDIAGAAIGATGDGAGIHIDLPHGFFDDAIVDSGHKVRPNRLAVGMVFLPRTDFAAQERCRTIVETEVLRMGHYIYGWRHVPVDTSVLGDKANATRPEIEQIMLAPPLDDAGQPLDGEALERDRMGRPLPVWRGCRTRANCSARRR